MSNNGSAESEDGQIISPNSTDAMDFSLSDEDADGSSSLDIKPPQASVRPENRKAERKDRDGHRREIRRDRNRDREREHRRHREKHRDRRHRNARDDLKEPIRDIKERRPHDRKRHDREKERDVTNADRVLQDLRSRLLDKRNRSQCEGDRREISTNNTSRESRPIERRDEETEARRERLLIAEREMARRKESSRAELQARRELRRENRRSPTPPESPEVARKRPRNASRDSIEKEISPDPTAIVTVSDNTEDDDEEMEEEEDKENSDDHSSSESESSEGDNKLDGSINSEDDGGSPLSVGELAKSEPNSPESLNSRSISKSKSRSRSRSRSQSRSNSDRSQKSSRSRTHSRSRSKSPVAVAEQPKPEPKVEEELDEMNILPPYLPGIQGCRSVEEFQCLNRIEEGTYGVVYRARDRRTEEIVALKRLKMEKEKEGFPITSLREINTLLKAQHPNIVTVREIVVGSNMDKIFIVMDYVEHDLKSLMETMRHKKQGFLPGEVKCLTQQLLCAVQHLHDNWILHRDLKTSNLLLSHKGILKVGDFGLAREYGSPLRQYTPVVVTLWYRSPELLLCCKEYSTAIDIWSVGCIFAELLTMSALFPGKSEVDQLNRIFKDLGTPNDKIWPGYSNLPAVQKVTFTEYPVSSLNRRFNHMLGEVGLNLLNGFLTYDPKQRITAEDALKHQYFKELPLAIDPAMFPTWPAKSELGTRKALASSPKPPSGGDQFKALGHGDGADDSIGFHWGPSTSGTSLLESRKLAMGGGFSLKF